MKVHVPFPCSPADLQRVSEALYPFPRWRATMAEDLLVPLGTLDNWLHGRRRVPGPAVAALRMIAERRVVNPSLEDLLS